MISIWFTVTKIDQCRSIKLEKTIFTEEFGKAIHDFFLTKTTREYWVNYYKYPLGSLPEFKRK